MKSDIKDTATTRKVKFNQTGNHEVLEMVNEPIPEPEEDEIVVQMKTFGLNKAEQLFYEGHYLDTPELPNPIGVEGAGIIHSLGEKSDVIKRGDRVSILPAFDFSEYGIMGDYAVVTKDAVIKIPDYFSFRDGSSVWMSFPTAYAGLVLKGRLKERHSPYVVISAASSSVGLSAIQIAKRYKATVIATTRTSKKVDFLLENGADYAIATQEEDFVKRIKKITNDKGFDIALDALAGSFLTSLGEAAAMEASIIIYGNMLSMEDALYPLLPAIAKGLDISSIHVNINLLRHSEKLQEVIEDILSGFKDNLYDPVIDKTFALEDFKDAYAYLEKGSLKGKVLIENE